jgi:hypothetical protein
MQLWNTGRATAYGAAIGLVAAAFKMFAPWSAPHGLAAIARELAGAALAFALLCGVVVALRNFIARRLIRPEIQEKIWRKRKRGGRKGRPAVVMQRRVTSL